MYQINIKYAILIWIIVLILFTFYCIFRLNYVLPQKEQQKNLNSSKDLYSKFNTDYKRLYELENFKEKGKDKIDNIIDNHQIKELEQKNNLNEEANLDIKNEFHVDVDNKITAKMSLTRVNYSKQFI